MSDELQRCPWCDGDAILRERFQDGRRKAAGKWFWVHCTGSLSTKCKVRAATKPFNTAEEAVAAWNTRVSEESK